VSTCTAVAVVAKLTIYPWLRQVNAPRLNPSQTGRYSIYLPQRDRRLSLPVTCTVVAVVAKLTIYPWLRQVNTHPLNPRQTGRYSIYLSRRDRRLSWPSDVYCCCCSCEAHYLPVAGDCVDEALIIGLSAGLGGLILVGLLITVFLLAARRTSSRFSNRLSNALFKSYHVAFTQLLCCGVRIIISIIII